MRSFIDMFNYKFDDSIAFIEQTNNDMEKDYVNLDKKPIHILVNMLKGYVA